MAGGNRASGRAAPQIRYALSQLRSRNGHHEFEHLCRELARVRITPDILPATGPVSGGGDQGRDFETFRTGMRERLPGSFAAAEKDQRIVFACTLQRENLTAKINSDLRAITGGGPVDRVYFFCEQDIKVSERHKLRESARQDHGTDIEIIDGQALSELLAAEDCLWIAERYLGVEVPDLQPGTWSLSGSSSGVLSGTTGIGIGAVHGTVNVYKSETDAVAPSGAGHRRRTPTVRDSSVKRRRRTAASLTAGAAAAALAVVLTPWHHSPSARNPGTALGSVSPSARNPATALDSVSPSARNPATVPDSVSPRAHNPGTVLDELAGREWTGTASFDRTFTKGAEGSVLMTLSVDLSPSSRPGAHVGYILYGEGCPSETVTLIRNDPRVLALATGSLTGPVTAASCSGQSASAVFVTSGEKPTITITLAGTGPQVVISVFAGSSNYSIIYRATLHIST